MIKLKLMLMLNLPQEKRKNYKVVSVLSKDGCNTKFNPDGRYSSDKSGTPLPAAKKAFSELCRVKNIRGQCTFFVTVEESYRGSNKKQFSPMKRVSALNQSYLDQEKIPVLSNTKLKVQI